MAPGREIIVSPIEADFGGLGPTVDRAPGSSQGGGRGVDNPVQMSGSAQQFTRPGSRLFAIYAVASLVPLLVLGFVLYRSYRHEGLDRALGQGRAQAAVIEEMAIAPVLGKHDLGAGLHAGERERLLRATDLAIFSGSVVRLRVRSFAGRVVFSDDGSTAGALPTSDPAFRVAAAGGRDVALVADPSGGSGLVIRVLQPIVPNASGQATGVLEVYLPYAAIAAKVQAQLHRASVRLVGVLAALYLILALISWSTTRRLRRHAAERAYQALHDPLTGLPNREWFRLRAERAVSGAATGASGAVVLLDLDRFKEVNDSLGHHAGDELLRVVARRLSSAVRTDDVAARLGGDEFGLLLPGVGDATQALELVGRIRADLAADLTLESIELGIDASFGIALYPEHGTTVEQLLKHADAAMYRGKRGTAGVVLYEPAAAPPTNHSVIVQGEVRHALERDELLLHYQPKIALSSGSVRGLEALLRWQHPQRGLLAPGDFLPAVERSALIEPLTAWVLRQALEDHGRWLAAGVHWPVSVNVSARNLESPAFADLVMDVVSETGVAAEALCLEVTETALASDAEIAGRTLTTLAGNGIAIAVDDFGMGYASLSRLRTLPVHEVKIDRAFVMGLESSEQDRSIARSIIELGHGLGCSVTAEGVETPQAAEWLSAASCDSAQGYHFARPAPWEDLLQRLGGQSSHAGIATTTEEEGSP
jgi:diguanylate cyclase (GGDEF)-like protein